MPAAIKSVDLLHGNDGAGTITQTNFPHGSPTPYIKHRIDAIDIENRTTKFTLIEGDELGDNLESIEFEVKCEESSDGGCIIKVTRVYNPKGDFVLKEGDIKARNYQAKSFYSAVLVANPNVCV